MVKFLQAMHFFLTFRSHHLCQLVTVRVIQQIVLASAYPAFRALEKKKTVVLAFMNSSEKPPSDDQPNQCIRTEMFQSGVSKKCVLVHVPIQVWISVGCTQYTFSQSCPEASFNQLMHSHDVLLLCDPLLVWINRYKVFRFRQIEFSVFHTAFPFVCHTLTLRRRQFLLWSSHFVSCPPSVIDLNLSR